MKGLILAAALAATGVAAADQVPFAGQRWAFHGAEAGPTEHLGRPALRLHNAMALLDDAGFENGVIEFDIAFSGERGFGGVIWRVADLENHEYFYLRPHQSGNPDANQYTPVYNGLPAWQLYHGPGYGAPVDYPRNEWIHVKLEVWQDQARVFIGDMEAPAVLVPHLKRRPAAGGIGFRAQNAPVHVSGFSYRPVDAPPFERLPPVAAAAPAGTVPAWDVSSPFDTARVEPADAIRWDDFPDLRWQTLRSEASGIANLASLHGTARGRDTVFARTTIHSDRAGLRELRFGYSDRITIFVNGRPVYAGDNTYRSRDYRYLGTIGLFDSVFLPLDAGANEVSFAVSEAFGGWGIIAQLVPVDPFEYAWQEIADGVHVGIREDGPRTPVMGTTTFVVGGDGVIVFDGGGVPLMSERVIARIRGVTDKPVTHVVISHWHQDHNWGIRAFVDAFPGVEIVSHPYTRNCASGTPARWRGSIHRPSANGTSIR